MPIFTSPSRVNSGNSMVLYYTIMRAEVHFQVYSIDQFVKTTDDLYLIFKGELWNISWWRHQMKLFSALPAPCEGNPPVTGEFPSQKPVTRSFPVFFDQRLNKRLSKYSRRRLFATSSRSLWRHCKVFWKTWNLMRLLIWLKFPASVLIYGHNSSTKHREHVWKYRILRSNCVHKTDLKWCMDYFLSFRCCFGKKSHMH